MRSSGGWWTPCIRRAGSRRPLPSGRRSSPRSRIARRGARGIELGPLNPRVEPDAITYSHVVARVRSRAGRRTSRSGRPKRTQPDSPERIVAAGDQFWPLRAFRELDDALLRLRFNEPEIGTIVVRTTGDVALLTGVDRTLDRHRDHWLVREVIHLIKRTLKRLDLTSRSFVACIEPGNAFAGTLFELALAADRSYMLDDPEAPEHDRPVGDEPRRRIR